MDVVKHLVGIARDWVAFPIMLLGALCYTIAEIISGKKFTRRANMAIAEEALNSRQNMNRAERRRRR